MEPVTEVGDDEDVTTVDVVCPDDGVAGDVLSVQIRHGGEETFIDVEIPEGVRPGERFEVRVA